MRLYHGYGALPHGLATGRPTPEPTLKPYSTLFANVARDFRMQHACGSPAKATVAT
jgi:hypothetical protein